MNFFAEFSDLHKGNSSEDGASYCGYGSECICVGLVKVELFSESLASERVLDNENACEGNKNRYPVEKVQTLLNPNESYDCREHGVRPVKHRCLRQVCILNG